MISLDEGSRTRAERLDSWKDIAKFLNRSCRTVQRWEKQEGLPVHRLLHNERATVFSYANELEEWWKSRGNELSSEPPAIEPLKSIGRAVHGRRRLLISATLTTLAVLLADLVYSHNETRTASQPARENGRLFANATSWQHAGIR